MKYRLLIQVFVLLQISLLVYAQTEDCPVEIDVALTTANETCIGTGRNQVCYGNNRVNVMPYDDIDLDFDSPGDIAEIAAIRSLSLSALNVDDGQWGIAVMHLLANLHPSEAEDVTVLLFGDVEIEDASGQQLIQVVTSNAYANMRRLPDSDATVVDSVAIHADVELTGRLADNTWVRAINPETNIVGWIFASLLDDVDFESLEIVSANMPYFAPMQAFYFSSGTNTSVCSSVPRDGMVVQTPDGLRRVSLWINEVTIDFLPGAGSTASIHTEDDGSMSVNVLEGSVYVGSDTSGYVAVAGSSVNVKKTSDANVFVSKPTATRSDTLDAIPLDNLDRDIEIPEPASDEMIDSVNGIIDTDASTTNEIEAGDGDDITPSSEGQSVTDPVSGNGNGNSANAPGQSDCPGNSCNAPGKNKDKNNGKGKNKNK